MCKALLLTSIALLCMASLGQDNPSGRPPEVKNPPDIPYRVGGEVSAPRAVYAPDPEYSQEASKAGLEGTLVALCKLGDHTLAIEDGETIISLFHFRNIGTSLKTTVASAQANPRPSREIHWPDIHRAFSRLANRLLEDENPRRAAIGSYLFRLIDKVSASGTGLSARQQKKISNVYTRDPECLGLFRVDVSDPGFDSIFVSRANT